MPFLEWYVYFWIYLFLKFSIPQNDMFTFMLYLFQERCTKNSERWLGDLLDRSLLGLVPLQSRESS